VTLLFLSRSLAHSNAPQQTQTMKNSSRRDFLTTSATVAAALSLDPIGKLAQAEATPASAAPGKADPAAIRALEKRLMRATPVPLDRVRLTGGPLKRAQDVTREYLLSLDPDRMMAYYRVRAGLAQKAEPYGGWDGGGRNLTGHIAGHHLSAVSLMYAATGDAKFKDRADYLVREMAEVQAKNGDGYLGALENLREAFAAVSRGEIRSGGFDLNGLWSPWYTLHKTFAGLRDAYRYTGNRNALAIEAKFAGWADGVLAPLTDAQVQKMLLTEHGGMNEVLADLYADTGDERWLRLSYRFEHHAFTDALKRSQDNLDGKHGNCQIPKLIGSAARYGYTADGGDLQAANFFFDRVAQHHSYATGGHGLSEYFGPPDVLSPRVDGRTCESCNEYNMVKLGRRLFSFHPDGAYMDYNERALFNHVLASIDPADGTTSYMVPVGRGVQQEYQDMQRSFTCCVGTGMENPALHGHGVYYESPDALWVNLYVPTTARLVAREGTVSMDTGFPEGETAKITLNPARAQAFRLALRRPTWAGDGFTVKVNGAAVEVPPIASLRAGAAGGRALGNEDALPMASTYVEIQRTWKAGDVVEVTLPKTLAYEPTPDSDSVGAIMWGPLVLAGNFGPRVEGRRGGPPPAPIPMLVAGGRPVTDWVVPSNGDFVAKGVAKFPAEPSRAAGDVVLTPFYRTHRKRYSVYFDVLSPGEFDAKVAGINADRERAAAVQAATLGFAQPGDEKAEKEFNYQSQPADRQRGRGNGRTSRAGTGWFSFDLPVDASGDNTLLVTYFNEVGLPPALGRFDIVVDGQRIGSYSPDRVATGFFDARYAIPVAVTTGKSKVTVKFDAGADGRIVAIYGVRLIRGK
jgi:DUF1680 family protein